jgi:predicted glycosyltransferase
VTKRKQVLVYAQSLSGVGHHVRASELAAALAREHDVFFAHGSRTVPRTDPERELETVPLPGLLRGESGLEPIDSTRRTAEVLHERSAILRRAAARIRPDVVLVEHYPFSKWELTDEVDALFEAAATANPKGRRISSVRDVSPKTRHESTSPEDYAQRVVETLNGSFDVLLIHSDPAFTRLEEHFPAASEIEIPVVYTGFVSEVTPQPTHAEPGRARERRQLREAGGYAILSCGGGTGSFETLSQIARAWRRLAESGACEGRTLVIFAGLFWSDEEFAALRAQTRDGPFILKAFSRDFLAWMREADLSISRAGYNTCVNVLATRCRALLLPNPQMSDQGFRAQRLAELGLAASLPTTGSDVDALAAQILTALHRERPSHGLDLGGAERTCALIEPIATSGPLEARLGGQSRDVLERSVLGDFAPDSLAHLGDRWNVDRAER